jgi:hypothetical protein
MLDSRTLALVGDTDVTRAIPQAVLDARPFSLISKGWARLSDTGYC